MKSLLLFLFLTLTLCGKDYYELLGVKRDATKAEIKKAYRKLSLKEHPDKGGDPKKYAEITNAYEVLIDDTKRNKYDLNGEEGLKDNGQRFRNPFGFNFFGEEEDDQNKHLPHQILPIEVSLDDLYNGRTIRAYHRKHTICHSCHGSGAHKASDVKKCPVCGGSGVTVKTMQLGGFGFTRIQQTCEACGGKGTTIAKLCPVCGGKKVEPSEEVITIYIEKGMDDGDEIVFNEEGDQKPGITPGDLKLVIQTAKHPRFTRKGNDLHTKVHISLLEALTGFKTTMKHLDNHEVTLERSDITKPGFVMKVKGEGMPIKEQSSDFGDLYVKFVVDFPDSLTDSQKESIKTILKK